MPADPRLDQMTFLTAHNAYANGVDGGFAPPFVNLAKNQTRGIVQQLNDGVRGFMLDIHQTPDGAILCHNSCTLGQQAGGAQRRHPADRGLPSTNNRGEIITVFLEDYVDASTLRAELRKVQGLNDVLYRAEGVQQNGWPTRSQMQSEQQAADDLHRPRQGRARGLRRAVPEGLDRRELLVDGIGTGQFRLVLLQPMG